MSYLVVLCLIVRNGFWLLQQHWQMGPHHRLTAEATNHKVLQKTWKEKRKGPTVVCCRMGTLLFSQCESLESLNDYYETHLVETQLSINYTKLIENPIKIQPLERAAWKPNPCTPRSPNTPATSNQRWSLCGMSRGDRKAHEQQIS